MASIWKNQEVSLACHKWEKSQFYIQADPGQRRCDDRGRLGRGGEDQSCCGQGITLVIWTGTFLSVLWGSLGSQLCLSPGHKVSSCRTGWGEQGCGKAAVLGLLQHSASPLQSFPPVLRGSAGLCWAHPKAAGLCCAPGVPSGAQHGALPPRALLLVPGLILVQSDTELSLCWSHWGTGNGALSWLLLTGISHLLWATTCVCFLFFIHVFFKILNYFK